MATNNRELYVSQMKKEAAIAIKKLNKYKKCKTEEYQSISQNKMYPENNNNEYNFKEY